MRMVSYRYYKLNISIMLYFFLCKLTITYSIMKNKTGSIMLNYMTAKEASENNVY